MDQILLKKKVEARQHAELLIELAVRDSDDVELKSHFWTILRDFCESKIPADKKIKRVEEITPMTDAEADRFANSEMPYGEFKGETVSSVPIDRLDWYAAQTDVFRKDLNRYMLAVRKEFCLEE